MNRGAMMILNRYDTDRLLGVQENRHYTFREVNINKICPIKDHNGKSGKIIELKKL
jgi:hypothetical protein